MGSGEQAIAVEFPWLIRVYKDGTVERITGKDFVPPSVDPQTGVQSKDVTMAVEPNVVSARLFLPKLTNPSQKLPLLIYFHGGAFCVSSPFTAKYHKYVNTIVGEANVIAVSVDYRLAPEHPIPAAYEDSWAALRWVFSHKNKDGPEPWLNEHADFGRVFLGGESAGANIAHHLAIHYGEPGFELGVELLGIALVHPFFWGSEPIGSEATDPDRKALVDKLWPFLCPSNPNNDDPRVNPFAADAPDLAGLQCRRMLMCVAEKDAMRDRGYLYYETLSKSGWMGVAEIMETEEEQHGFHLLDMEGERAKNLIKRLAAFYNRDMSPLV